MSLPRQSAIYVGKVQHRRHLPRFHAFSYTLYMLYIDLAEIQTAFDHVKGWSLEHKNFAQFRRADYMGPPELPLDTAVRDKVEQQLGVRPSGPIRLLTHARYFGYLFNPISVYYCFQSDGVTLETIVAEVTNTPWKERHYYVLPVGKAACDHLNYSWSFEKMFHVSPFMPVDYQYHWRMNQPSDTLRIHMNVLDPKIDPIAKVFDATLHLERLEWTPKNLRRMIYHFPFMTLKVSAAIYWQALRLWLKRVPPYKHPSRF